MSAEEFRRLRIDADLTQNRAAELLGVTTRTISRWESGLVPIDPLKAEAIRRLLTSEVLR